MFKFRLPIRAQLDQDTGVLTYSISNNSITAFTDITTTETGTVSGSWSNPVMNAPVGMGTVTHCANNGGLVDACIYVILNTPSDIGILASSDPIIFNLDADDKTVFETSVARIPPEVPVAATTEITYTLKVIDLALPPSTYTISGDLTGLIEGTLQLDLNGTEQLAVVADGTFAFSSTLENLVAYSVTVDVNPAGLVCEVINGDGAVPNANVTNISVSCSIDPGICPTAIVTAINDGVSQLENISTYSGASMASCKADFCPVYYLCGSQVSYEYSDPNVPNHTLILSTGFTFIPGPTEGYFVESRTIDVDDGDAVVSDEITWADDIEIPYDLDEELACHTYFKEVVEASTMPCDLTP